MTTSKIKIGITGQNGFLGYHLACYFNRRPERYQVIPFLRSYFEDEKALVSWISHCDVVIHLAGLNRGEDKEVYQKNLELTGKISAALNGLKAKLHLLFASSPHEDRPTAYGRSKKESRLLLAETCKKAGVPFAGLIIPNTFGPFAKPNYNSAIATFCHQLTHGLKPRLHQDAELGWIDINTLTRLFDGWVLGRFEADAHRVEPVKICKVGLILDLLRNFKTVYLENNIIPYFQNSFEVALFNTFRSYMDAPSHHRLLEVKTDNRGGLAEFIKSQTQGQAFYSWTHPGVTRGNHYHTRKVERFCVVSGQAVIRLRRVGFKEVHEYPVTGEKVSIVDMPVLYAHNITSTGNAPLLTLFWSNEIFNPEDPDTFAEPV